MRGHVIFLSLALAAAPAAAQQPPASEPTRQLGAHSHGTGKLNIAIEKRTLEIELEVPGNDIVGFESAAKTTEQKKAIADARALLAKPLVLFKPPEAAGCKVVSAKVKLVTGDHGHGHGHSHGHSHGKGKASANEAAHSEFEAEYQLNCAKPELIDAMELEYFKSFPRAEALDVTIVGAKGQQSKQKVTRAQPRLQLKGAL